MSPHAWLRGDPPPWIRTAGEFIEFLTATQDVALATLATLVDVKVTRVLAVAGAGRTGRSDAPRKKVTLT
jgi:hypothetical protein